MLSSGKLGLWGLTALVFGLVVGVGIFNIPQTQASVAGPVASTVAWLVTGVGILPLVLVFRWLSVRYPQYNAGIYQYAQAGFGNYVGFNIAWGYWLCTAFSNVAYGLMLNDAVGSFCPVLLEHGWASMAFCTALIWVMYFIVVRGVRTAKFVNNALALIKGVMIALVVVIFVMMFRFDLFTTDMLAPQLGTIADQVDNSMMITLFCFFGIEGAVMMSARARRPRDVGRAGIMGFVLALALYLAIGVLCYGLVARAGMAGLPNPSIAYILLDACGPWAYWFIISAIIIALLGGWVAWTLVVAQVPYEAAQVGILPGVFKRVNQHNMPSFGLKASSFAMTFFLVVVFVSDNAYLAALRITGLMIIPCYLFTGLFVAKVAARKALRALGVFIVVFCLYMAYAGGLVDMLMTSIFYLAGAGFYIRAEREKHAAGGPVFSGNERWLLRFLVCASAATVVLLAI